MKILWLTNVPLPVISNSIGNRISPFGGWLVTVANQLLEDKKDLCIVFPNYSNESVQGQIDNLSYFGYKEKSHSQYKFDTKLEKVFIGYIESFAPDIIHIWGTEYPRALSMLNAAHHLNFKNVVVSIQGICSAYKNHYFAGLPNAIIHKYSLRDIIRRDNIYHQYLKFCEQAKWEEKALSKADYIIGRTTWDFACTKMYASQAKYFYCAETLRPSFYEQQWSYDECEKHSIFVSQSSYPIKGFHKVLQALPEVLKHYPDTILYTTGTDPRSLSIRQKTAYHLYLEELLNNPKVAKAVVFLGTLNETQMRDRYLKSNVFVSPSSIENSPNSVGEAMLLGLPIVASYVGGTMDMLRDKTDGFLYQQDAEYMLAFYIKEVFANVEKSIEMGNNAQQHALQTHDKKKNMEDLLLIYDSIMKN